MYRLTFEALRIDMALPIELDGEVRSPLKLLYARLPVRVKNGEKNQRIMREKQVTERRMIYKDLQREAGRDTKDWSTSAGKGKRKEM